MQRQTHLCGKFPPKNKISGFKYEKHIPEVDHFQKQASARSCRELEGKQEIGTEKRRVVKREAGDPGAVELSFPGRDMTRLLLRRDV